MKAPYAVFVTKIGGPEVLVPKAIEMPRAGPREVVIEHTAIAVNFVDVYLRSGQPHSHNPEPPFIPGVSAVGRVVEVGSDVSFLKVGDKVILPGFGGAAVKLDKDSVEEFLLYRESDILAKMAE